jgi:hypothetical protein
MAVRWKEKIIEGVVLGVTLAIMSIFVGFIWNQAFKVSSVMINVETKLQEVVDTFNETVTDLDDRLYILENNVGDNFAVTTKEAVEYIEEPIFEMAPPSPAPVIEEDYQEEPYIEQRIQQIEPLQKIWTK